MTDSNPASDWRDDRTTFQRVYDILVGTESLLEAAEFAERAHCSETAARSALEQLSEMGIADRRDGRPARYRRNESYLRWQRVESLAREHGATELQERIDDLIAEDEAFQNEFGVPDPDAVSSAAVSVDDHDDLHQHWAALREWRTVRRDIRLLRRAVDRVHSTVDDGVQA